MHITAPQPKKKSFKLVEVTVSCGLISEFSALRIPNTQWLYVEFRALVIFFESHSYSFRVYFYPPIPYFLPASLSLCVSMSYVSIYKQKEF